ncbi:sensor histidine kinase [Flindersiella endophytica]
MRDEDDAPAAVPGEPVSPGPNWLRLESVLRELIERAGQVLDDEHRIHRLLDAVVSIGRSLDYSSVAVSAIDAACTLVDARYGALAVVGPDQTISDFRRLASLGSESAEDLDVVTSGPDGGLGLLGDLIGNPRPIRVSRSDAVDYSFLGVPVRVREEIHAVLYVTDKRRGEFGQEDEDALIALSAATGIAIENARSYEKTVRNERWLLASNEIMSRLLSGSTSGGTLDLIAERVGEVAGSDLALLAQLDERRDHLVVEVATGTGADAALGRTALVAGTSLPELLRLGEPRLYDLDGHPSGVTDWLSDLVTDSDLLHGSAIVVPLGVATQPAGVLTMVRSAGAPPFDEVDLQLAETFAGHAALALEFGQIQADRAELAVFQDRDRIARDLHDRVIQRLFAVALGLLGLSRQPLPAPLSERVRGYVSDLDATIAEIRRTIFFLQEAHTARASLRAQLLQTADLAAGQLGFEPHVELSGPLDSAVDDELRPQLVATIREALAGLAARGSAHQVSVFVLADVEAELLIVGVENDGAPPGSADLEAFVARADTYGGTFEVGERPGGRTRLSWRLPLER